MSIYNNINGGTKEVSGLFENKNGGVFEIQSKWENKNGVLRKVYTGIDLPPGPEYPAVPPTVGQYKLFFYFDNYHTWRTADAANAHTINAGGTNKFTNFKGTLCLHDVSGGSGYRRYVQSVSVQLDGIQFMSLGSYAGGYSYPWDYYGFDFPLPESTKNKINKNENVSLYIWMRYTDYGESGDPHQNGVEVLFKSLRFQ